MPRIAPEKVAAGAWAARDDGRPALTVPDQSRYGAVHELHDEPGNTFTEEGGGTVATCNTCGWLRWNETRREAETTASDHKCRSGDRCLICGPPYELGDDGCPHYISKKDAARV